MLASNRHCKLIRNISDSTLERGQSQKKLSWVEFTQHSKTWVNKKTVLLRNKLQIDKYKMGYGFGKLACFHCLYFPNSASEHISQFLQFQVCKVVRKKIVLFSFTMFQYFPFYTPTTERSPFS